MDEITSTTNQRPAPRRSRVSKSTMPNIPTFGGEFQREEPTYNLDDVLLSGSDDEYYDSPNERSRRLEEQARLFLQGHRPLLLSASLRGPFGRETGWENPWIGRRSKITKTGTSHCSASLRAPLASTSEVGVAARTRTATTRRSSISGSSAKGLTINDLRAAPDITYTDKDPEVKKRAAGADWLRRRNFKRMRPNDDDVTASPTPTRSSKTTVIPSVASSPKKSALSRSVSAPVSRTASSSDQDVATAATPSDGVATESNVKSQPSHIAEDMNQSVSHISDSEVAMSLPSDLLWASNPGAEQPSPQDEKTSEDEGYVQSDPDTTTPIRDKSTTTIGDDTTLFSAEDELTSEVDAESSLLMECPAVDNEPSANIEDGDDDMQQNVEPVVICEDEAERITSHADNIATDAFATDADAVETEAMPASLDDTEMENDRLETQYQSPWAKTQTSVMTGLMVSDVGSTKIPLANAHTAASSTERKV
ncbi:hypothetical protein SBRCBS47491_003849 [Sporothrix bragantina]|uniref:Uncharacterized protein n=1 Tax=Sporothrix bragantina TaxID=671064 RepID=A0ABP0BIN6_9PEZI